MTIQAIQALILINIIATHLEKMDDRLIYADAVTAQILDNYMLLFTRGRMYVKFMPITGGTHPMIYPTSTIVWN